MRLAAGFVIVLVYSIAYLWVAFTDDSTMLWWWFVPILGTYKIFQTSIGLGIFHVGILPVVWVSAFLARDEV